MVDGGLPIEKAACSIWAFTSRRFVGSTPGPCDNPAAWSRSGEPSYARSHSEVGIAGGVPSLKSTVRVERALDAARPRA